MRPSTCKQAAVKNFSLGNNPLQIMAQNGATDCIPNFQNISTSEAVDILCTEFGCLLEQLKQRESLTEDAAVQTFLRKKYNESAHSFSEMKTVKLLTKVSDSVCLICVEGAARGTGFLLFDRFILTNGHVIEHKFDKETRKLYNTVTAVFGFEDQGMGKELQVKDHIVAYCHGKDDTGKLLDFALLELSDDAELPVCCLLLSSYSPPPTKGGICIVGHPDGGVKLMDPCFIIEKHPEETAEKKSENILHIMSKKCLEEMKSEINYSSWFLHGSSGSPVFNVSCELIGVHSGGYAYKDERGETQRVVEYALPMLPILAHILKQVKEKRRTDVVKYFESQTNMEDVLQAADHLKDHPRENLSSDSEVRRFFREEYDKSVETFNEVHKVKQLMKLSNSVCLIYSKDSKGNKTPLGTGFLFTRNCILTNAHVIGNNPQSTMKLSQPITAVFGYEAPDSDITEVQVKEKIVAFYQHKRDGENGKHVDFVLLELSRGVKYIELLQTCAGDTFSSNVPEVSGGTCIIGHPDGGIKKLDFSFIIQKAERDQAVQKHLAENPDYVHIITQKSITEKWQFYDSQFTYDSCLFYGSSGSPVFNESCELIGVHTGGYVYPGDGGKTRSVIEYGLSMRSILIHLSDLKDFFPEVPYRQVLPEGLKDQTLITVCGEPKQNADRFMIDICKGTDIAFHFNPRFNDNGKQVIVRNSWIKGVWGPEERHPPFFPFTPGKPFEIKILCTSSEYRVEVDDRHVLNYSHRMKELDQITHLLIHHDVVLKYVHIEFKA
ncbi:uncharacterized protein LOC118801611 isoform X2 [Colossoma macropomum]|uniref:uncharacterized protein LOC118801611 isoform X2 n=1 Tax=Colossoma macropomum TaxID=42526 RepID=UPI001864647D|nr:uncharacterized protein LOC118801611 isoform X2 [Colossoma macropomum]